MYAWSFVYVLVSQLTAVLSFSEIVVVSRFCLIKPGASDGCIAVEGDGSFYIQCLCSTDNCNSGRSILPSILTVLVTCLTALWVMWR